MQSRVLYYDMKIHDIVCDNLRKICNYLEELEVQ